MSINDKIDVEIIEREVTSSDQLIQLNEQKKDLKNEELVEKNLNDFQLKNDVNKDIKLTENENFDKNDKTEGFQEEIQVEIHMDVAKEEICGDTPAVVVKEDKHVDTAVTMVSETHLEEILKEEEENDFKNVKNENSKEIQQENVFIEENTNYRSFEAKNESDGEIEIVGEKHQEHGDIIRGKLEESNEKSSSDRSKEAEVKQRAEHVNTDNIDATDGSFKLPLKKDIPVDINDPDNFVDILGNNQLTKRVLAKGLGRESRPTHGDFATISYKAWNSRGMLFAEEMESLVVGDGDMIQAFDLALCLAEKHEEFELITDARFAYGILGLSPDILPNETLKYHIKLLEVEDAPDYATLSYEDRVDAADRKRERGNYLYRREEFSYAVNSYSRAIKIIETEPDFKKSFNDSSKSQLFEVFVKVTNNLAASQLKLENFDSVIETCDNILCYDPTNVKALFRKGKGLTMKGSYDEAIVVLKKAFELDSKNKLIVNEIQKCTKLKRAEDDSKLKLYRRMFGNATEEAPSAELPSLTGNRWKNAFYKYSPYMGAALATGLSIFLATVAITKSKGV